ncbi:Halomucin, partial [Frankliniella fusca]
AMELFLCGEGESSSRSTCFKASYDRDPLDIKMNQLAKERSKEFAKLKSTQAANSNVPANKKRKLDSSVFYGNVPKTRNAVSKKKEDNEKPKMFEEEKTRKRIFELNKKEAEKRNNLAILLKSQESKKSKVPDDDDDWSAETDNSSMDSDIQDQRARDSEARKEKNDILRNIRETDLDADENSDSKRTSNECDGPSRSKSPTKEELMKQIELMRKQLESKDSKSNGSDRKKRDESGGTKTSPLKDDKIESSERDSLDMHSDKDDKAVGSERESQNLLSDNDDSINEKPSKGNDDVEFFASEEDYSNLEHQLYGPSDDTTELCHGIFIKKNDLTSALTGSTNVNHLLRRMMVGVFNPAEIQSCTVTGQSWHAGGSEACSLKPEPLHPKALQAIVDFSNNVAKKKKWQKKGLEKARPIFAVKLTEIKKSFEKKKSQKKD